MKADVVFKEDKSKVTVLPCEMVNVTVWLLVNEEMVKVWLSVPEAASPAGPAGPCGPCGPVGPVGPTNSGLFCMNANKSTVFPSEILKSDPERLSCCAGVGVTVWL